MSSEEQRQSRNTALQKAEEYPVGFPVQYEQQQDEEIHLRDYLRVVLRRKWTVITFFLVVVTTVVVATFLMTPTYRATATIKIDKENPNVLQFKDVYEVQRVEDDYYQTQYKILKSRNLAKRVVRTMKLDNNPILAGEPEKASGLQAASTIAPQEEVRGRSQEGDIKPMVIDAFLNRVTVEPQQRSRLVKVSFDSPDPGLSAAVANEIARSYIGFSIESKFEATVQAREWLEKQIIDLKAKVERSEEALNAYASRHGIIYVTGARSGDAKESETRSLVATKLEQLSANLVQATSERIAKEALYREIQHGEAESNPVVLSSPLIQALKKDLSSLESEYSQLSKVYKPDYPKMVRIREQIEQMQARINAEVKRTVNAVKADYAAAVKRENTLTATLDQYKGEALNLNEKMIQYQILKREVDTNRELYNGLLQRLKETGVSASLTSSNIQVLDRAEVPRSPHKPKRTMNFLIALMVGLFGGVGLAFFVEYLDNTVKSPEDLEKRVALPSLGLVPDIKDTADRKETAFLTHEDKRSSLSEAYRSIGTYIQFSSAVRPPKTIQITSARTGEGKTTTVINTAISLSHSYGRGLALDADLRKPQLHKIFDADNSRGLSSYLAGHIEFDSALIQQTKVENLDIITAGVIPPNPSELLSSHRMRDLINGLLPMYSFIVIDSPPILGLSDALIVSTLTDGVILVVRAGSTTRDSVAQAKKLLNGVNAKILGAVLNGVTQADLKYGAYSYYYSYYYEEGGYGSGRQKRDTGDQAQA